MVANEALPQFRHMSPHRLAELREAGEAPRVIDVRESHEWALARIDDTEHLPLSEISNWWRDLDRSQAIVFLCHHGNRSAAVCRALAAEGFANLSNLVGGLDAWSLEVDSTVPRY